MPGDAAPPSGLVPLEDRELDELITQASNDNIPLIDLGLTAPTGDSADFQSRVRRLGITPVTQFSPEALGSMPPSTLLVFDRDQAPNVDALKAAKAAGIKVAFSGGRSTQIDEARLKRRLQAIRSAGLGWKDFWVPGKP